MGLSDYQLEELRGIFKNYVELKAVYLFGSYAMGKEGKSSDLDLGIVLAEDYKQQIKLEILTELAVKGYCKVDLVILNEADLVTKHEIVKHNKVIYQRADFDTNDYFSLTMRQFLDFRPFLKVQQRYLKERVLNG
ncbi:type VII toxin-antitoxin system MntA family adenylyltransferase antitoxin [Fuchsiella alkaliacetigena]|uniref:type VII toxin-antitoxin system MntA family adenylyltransferase antitoxin n=1 Tax=Fuchsiella alkaliacetigena TaxID=957042 RepID=UPI00200AF784|nr:nucleotidyltransferase domain-containing protein [Fuchsiella alkaliacetigena]MCK8824293.1 nucleotidyltransferase domain-containing protein [Fuchsiella alkaliacetigena]